MNYDAEAIERAANRMSFYLDQDPAEKCFAVSVLSDPKELPQWWQIVHSPGKDEPRIELVHEVVASSHAARRILNLQKEFGDVDIVGETYHVKPYVIGYNRTSKQECDDLVYIQMMMSTKENAARANGRPGSLGYGVAKMLYKLIPDQVWDSMQGEKLAAYKENAFNLKDKHDADIYLDFFKETSLQDRQSVLTAQADHIRKRNEKMKRCEWYVPSVSF